MSIKTMLEYGQLNLDSSVGFVNISALEKIELICNRFHTICKSLRTRRREKDSSKDPILVEDEYDAQYIFEALLHIFFDDVCPEAWTPKYAGKSSRIDFELSDEEITIELKMTRHGLDDAAVADQLIIDLERYRSPDRHRYVVCFVYDTDERIRHPVKLCKDLNERHNGEATVIIKPQPPLVPSTMLVPRCEHGW